MAGTQYCEQLLPTMKRPEEDVEKLEWNRSYVASHVKPIKKDAAKEYIVLNWDPTSAGGVATYFQLNDNHVVSLIGHVRGSILCNGQKATRKNHNIEKEIDMIPVRESEKYEMYNVPEGD